MQQGAETRFTIDDAVAMSSASMKLEPDEQTEFEAAKEVLPGGTDR